MREQKNKLDIFGDIDNQDANTPKITTAGMQLLSTKLTMLQKIKKPNIKFSGGSTQTTAGSSPPNKDFALPPKLVRK